MTTTPYTYRVLRYLHDPATGEGLNIGVLVYAPACRWLEARFNLNSGRLKHAFPSLDADIHRALMRRLKTRFEAAALACAQELPFAERPVDLIGWAHTILRDDDSSLQWGAEGGGLTADPARELHDLYERMVLRHHARIGRQGRDDDEVWSIYRAPLQRTGAVSHLTKHAVKTELDEVTFDHAWKNGRWHCLQPLSLDLLEPESIRNKGHRLLGEISGIREALTNHTLYLLLAEPKESAVRKTADRTLNLLHARLGVKYELVREAEAESFGQRLSRDILAHTLENRG
jgi:Protein of unknown function (DUF3037)